MNTERLEKQLSLWNKFMYMALGAAIMGTAMTVVATLVASQSRPPSTAAIGIVWLLIPLTVTPPGFFLLLAKRWKALPLSRERLQTTFGYLIASWIALSAPLILGAGDDYNLFFLGYTVVLGLLYWRIRATDSKPEEVFP